MNKSKIKYCQPKGRHHLYNFKLNKMFSNYFHEDATWLLSPFFILLLSAHRYRNLQIKNSANIMLKGFTHFLLGIMQKKFIKVIRTSVLHANSAIKALITKLRTVQILC